MATPETIRKVAEWLFAAPLANKPKTSQDKQNAVKVMALTLKDIDDGLLEAATLKHIATDKWFPSISELRAAALSLVVRAAGLPDSYVAWQQIKRGSQHIHPMALEAINRLGGLGAFGMSNVDDEPSWRARFIQCYEQLSKRAFEDQLMLPAVKEYSERLMAGQAKVSNMVAELANGMMQSGKQVETITFAVFDEDER